MLDIDELKQLVAFDELGTLSKVAEEFHISTPSITRSMQHLEECFGVSLFNRGKNRIELNNTGKMAVECGRKLIYEASQTIEQVRAFDQRQRTVVIKSCAPAPLWELLKIVNSKHEGRMISSEICQNEDVLAALKGKSCDIGILPFQVEGGREFMQEKLYVCVPKEHGLAKNKTLTFSQINGFNFLLRSELGFWDTLCREKMPASKFLIQTDASVFDELIKESSLPCFTTDYGQFINNPYEGRVNIPITDKEAQVTFYIVHCD